jgi:hypothetical protein
MIAAVTDSGLMALHHIKMESGQEPRATNSRDEEHVDAKGSDQAVADLAALAAPVGAIAAATAAPQRAIATPKHVRAVPGKGQAVGDEVESGEGEDCEPVSKRRKRCATTSEYVNVSWYKKGRKWRAEI